MFFLILGNTKNNQLSLTVFLLIVIGIGIGIVLNIRRQEKVNFEISI